jgi:hypothetical protein
MGMEPGRTRSSCARIKGPLPTSWGRSGSMRLRGSGDPSRFAVRRDHDLFSRFHAQLHRFLPYRPRSQRSMVPNRGSNPEFPSQAITSHGAKPENSNFRARLRGRRMSRTSRSGARARAPSAHETSFDVSLGFVAHLPSCLARRRAEPAPVIPVSKSSLVRPELST